MAIEKQGFCQECHKRSILILYKDRWICEDCFHILKPVKTKKKLLS